ncbi:hypothetical protein [Saccharomonospora xinjiangensis]|uniref:Uncharacterized protein n=1 Tax=Saccharomonospora xinjiangensis XJ-54 TaxID=882086 RepID=I0V040_9PSEU|nr:hypothetical protein [Saccharomonospora xinjiangensis]EID53493.1 hypothetical protein SacxiDRAFT_1238 [Saccharomonospora xinjiangensis XJ-54]
MTLNQTNGIVGTLLSPIGHVIRERRHLVVSRYAQQSQGTGVRVGAAPAFSAVVGGAEAICSAALRMTGDLPKQFWVPLCPQERAP